MCCFSQPVELVAETSIFARGEDGRQFLVYSMTYSAAADLAMLLPLPVPPRPPQDAVTFINLERYPELFEDMASGFPRRVAVTFSADSLSLDLPTLQVHDVGSFEASFVPRVEDFDRLDPRFRLPEGVWDRLPAYRDYGFAVFKLKGAASERQVHPMALSFPRRSRDQLFFPTLHLHDREVHPHASFDHMLYCQPDRPTRDQLQDWEASSRPASEFVETARTDGIVAPGLRCWRLPLEGLLENKDAWIGKAGSIPGHAKGKPLHSRDG